MPFTATYAKYYGIGAADPSTRTQYPFTAGNTPAGGTTLSDTQDGTDDGELAVGAEVDWSDAGGTQTLVGVTDAGFPVIHSTHSNLHYVLTPAGSFAGQPFNFIANSYTMCFAAGTRIATPEGERAVETLARGDKVLTAEGRVAPVLWLGRKTCHYWISGDHMQPVRIRQGALGNGLPTRDLIVTADHGMVLEGLVINASALVNGWSITWEPLDSLGDLITYYHIETEAHEVILANGAASETFVTTESRSNFDNFASYCALYPTERPIPEMSLPRLASHRLVPQDMRALLDQQPGTAPVPA